MAYSRWVNTMEDSIEELVEKITNHETWYEKNIDEFNQEPLAYNIEFIRRDNEIELEGKVIKYSVIKYDFEKIRPGESLNTDRSMRVKVVKNYVLIFKDDDKIYYIINRTGSVAKSILRKLSNHTSSNRNTINENKFDFSQDIFNWLIFRLLNKKNPLINNIVVNKIIGFKGNVEQENQRLAEIRGSGNEIMNALSTLAFLFDNDGMSYIKPVINYDENHTSIEIDMRLNGTIGINIEEYTGVFIGDPEDIRKAKIFLLLHTLVLPKIISSFNTDVENNDWNLDVQIDMIKNIGEIIQNKVSEKIELLIREEEE